MKTDILYHNGDFVFSYRAAGILVNDGKILLQKPNNDDYALIGGHVAFLETTDQTVIREFQEELHASIEIERLLAVGEVFFPWGNKPCHQISLYYKVRLKNGDIPMTGTFSGYDDMGNIRNDLDYSWIPLDALRNGLRVYPLEIIPHILGDTQEIVHFISKEL